MQKRDRKRKRWIEIEREGNTIEIADEYDDACKVINVSFGVAHSANPYRLR